MKLTCKLCNERKYEIREDTDIATIVQQYHTEEPAKVVGMVYKYLNIQRALWFACGFVLGFILSALITMEVVL
jgi:hypothetical protein